MAQNAKSMSVRDRRPLYVQAIEALTNMIETGQLKTGSQLPPEDEFAAKLGISRSTLREALGHLETHGLIARRQGIGTFVTIPSSPGFFGGLQRLEPFKELARTADVQHSDVKVGDIVLFGKWSGTEIKIDGKEYSIMKESDIMGISKGK